MTGSSHANGTETGYQLLLIEPSSVIRNIIVSVAKQLGLAQVHQTGNVAVANEWLGQRSFDGILLAIYEPGPVIETLQRIRSGAFRCDAQVPVVALVRPGDRRLDQQVSELDVMRVLPVPFRIREVIDVMRGMWPERRTAG